MSPGPLQRWRERGRTARLRLPFDDIMAFALALLSGSQLALKAKPTWRANAPSPSIRSGGRASRSGAKESASVIGRAAHAYRRSWQSASARRWRTHRPQALKAKG